MKKKKTSKSNGPYLKYFHHSALQVLENILKTSDNLLADDLVSVLAEHCRDSSLAVRKQMVMSLTELVKTYPDNINLIKVWVDGVFPLILDVEAKAAEKVTKISLYKIVRARHIICFYCTFYYIFSYLIFLFSSPGSRVCLGLFVW